MRAVAITRILDEADIVEAFVRHSAAYVSHHIFVDNGSKDGTLQILGSLRADGFGITVFENRSVSFAEVHFNTFMLQEAVRSHDADWVLCLDADEFIDDRAVEGGLISALDRLGPAAAYARCVRVPLVEYHPSSHDDQADRLVPRRITRRAGITDNSKVFIPRALYGPETTVSPGNHSVVMRGQIVESDHLPGLRLAHFSTRSRYQWLGKYVKGWAKVLAAGPEEVNGGTSCHYRAPFEQVVAGPEAFFRSGYLDRFDHHDELELDPIVYRGGELAYTAEVDHGMRAVRSLAGYLEDLALRHGALLEQSPEARRLVREWDTKLVQVLPPPDPEEEPNAAPPAAAPPEPVALPLPSTTRPRRRWPAFLRRSQEPGP